MRKILFSISLTILLLIGGVHVRAQEAARAKIISVNADSFPEITALLDIYGPDGKFLSNVDATNIMVLEDGQAIPITALNEQEIGAQIVVAINPSPPMDTQDAFGISRYDQMLDVLRFWAEKRPLQPQDKLSLVSTAGPLLVNASPSEWHNSFVSYQPNARTSVPSLQSLSFAIDLLEGESNAQQGMKRSILFITSHLPDQSSVDTLEALTERANLLNTQINVWMLDSEEYFPHFSTNALKSMALQSGGDYFAFSGVETLPNPETYFSHLRHLYTFTYQSRLATAGTHRVSAKVQFGETNILSEDHSFSVDIQAPNAFLLSPPAHLVRQAPDDDPYNTEALAPTEESIEFLIEFPDGHSRPIQRATLFVDEEKVAEITSPPFEKFIWDISNYSASGEHSIQIEVEDSLGLTRMSLGVPLTLTVIQPPTGILAFFGRNGSLLTLGVVAFAGLFLVAILLVGGRRSLQRFIERRKEKTASHDPLTQPIPLAEEGENKKGLLKGFVRQPKLAKALAYLTRLDSNNEAVTGKPIPLTDEEMSLGADPVKVTFVLDDPSISPKHAKISQNEEGEFLLYDQDSVAGTWVNFEKINGEGKILAHGDLIHFGLLRYKFDLNKPPVSREPMIRVEEGLG
ncbi:MAG: FHA domain-containing protein [Anaerolineae bacterium]|jgi:hypothetical protein|nr:FHA domain-containing protein [Anaerolineae bacterium]MBT7075493.1 FHA domain-containing protein [Anaerolineae bacterium]MBT7781532.1 FHA domain-containing protein [Anaerolineae bacterium]